MSVQIFPSFPLVENLCAGLRSGFSYSGAFSIKEFHEKAKFVQITYAGLRESYLHDVELIYNQLRH